LLDECVPNPGSKDFRDWECLAILDLGHGREQLADIVSQLGIAVDALLEAWPFAGAIAGAKLVGQPGEQDVVDGAGGRHGVSPHLLWLFARIGRVRHDRFESAAPVMEQERQREAPS
jgi:hypothetical protein